MPITVVRSDKPVLIDFLDYFNELSKTEVTIAESGSPSVTTIATASDNSVGEKNYIVAAIEHGKRLKRI